MGMSPGDRTPWAPFAGEALNSVYSLPVQGSSGESSCGAREERGAAGDHSNPQEVAHLFQRSVFFLRLCRSFKMQLNLIDNDHVPSVQAMIEVLR